MKKPLLIVTFGYPGSGKTYFSERLAKKRHFFHLNADRIRSSMFASPKYTVEEHRMVFDFMDKLAYDMLRQDIDIVYDANINKKIYRKRLMHIAKESRAEYHLVWIRTSEEDALKRIERMSNIKDDRKRLINVVIDPVIFNKKKDQMELTDGKEKSIEIDGYRPFSDQYESFLGHLK